MGSARFRLIPGDQVHRLPGEAELFLLPWKEGPLAQYPAFPLWTDAYLGDTGHLTTLEHGAYFLLLMTMWRNKGTLPDDDSKLCRYTRLSKSQWLRIRPTIIEFFDIKDGQITQGRLTDEYKAVKQHSRNQSKKAKARWLKEKKTADPVAPPGHMPDACLPLPLTTSKKESPLLVPPGGAAKSLTFKQAIEEFDDLQSACFAKARRLFAEKGWPEISWILVWEEFSHYWGVEASRKKKVDWPMSFHNRATARRTWKSYASETSYDDRRPPGGRSEWDIVG